VYAATSLGKRLAPRDRSALHGGNVRKTPEIRVEVQAIDVDDRDSHHGQGSIVERRGSVRCLVLFRKRVAIEVDTCRLATPTSELFRSVRA